MTFVTTAAVFEALPKDGSRIPFFELLKKLDVDAEEGGMVRAVLLVLSDQGRADIEYGAGWYRTVDLAAKERYVLVPEGDNWGCLDTDTDEIASTGNQSSAQMIVERMNTGVTVKGHWSWHPWRGASGTEDRVTSQTRDGRFVLVGQARTPETGTLMWTLFDVDRDVVYQYSSEEAAAEWAQRLIRNPHLSTGHRKPSADQRLALAVTLGLVEPGAVIPVPTGASIINDDGSRWVLIFGEYPLEDFEDYEESEAYGIFDRTTGWTAWYDPTEGERYPLQALRKLRAGDFTLRSFDWYTSDRALVDESTLADAMAEQS